MGKQLTAGGYDMGEAVSALQKCIRRGMEREALYWALELNTIFPYYLWRRLVVIACEDIGIANPLLVATVASLKQHVEEFQNKYKDYDLAILGFVILWMCRSPKSREQDDYVNEILRAIRTGEMKLEIPDFALDQHTGRGRQMGRGPEFFWREGARLENESHPSAYCGWDPDRGDGYHDAAGHRVDAWPKSRQPEQDRLL